MSRLNKLTKLRDGFTWRNELERVIGSAWADTAYGVLCEEAVGAGYDLSYLYDGGSARWGGNFSKVAAVVAVARGAKSYKEYVTMLDDIKPSMLLDSAVIEPVSKTLFARLTGIKAPNETQTERTRRYRQRQRAELLRLRNNPAK